MKKRNLSALISVYSKEGLNPILEQFKKNKINIYSTGGTYEYIKNQGFKVTAIEKITKYPSILNGRVKSLHPKIFGGILAVKNKKSDKEDINKYKIPLFDFVIVDLYPFKETVKNTKDENKIIEKIDIGGISLIRAAAKNYKHVTVVASKKEYNNFNKEIEKNKGSFTLTQKKKFAEKAFKESVYYDSCIYKYFTKNKTQNHFYIEEEKNLRYGENPHQEASFYGDINKILTQIHGKQISYNNLLDIDSAINLIIEFNKPTFAILKHNNPCGVATNKVLKKAWKKALAGDPVSAFGGVIITNSKINFETAKEIDKLFVEVLIAKDFDKKALEVLKSKKNRIILKLKKNKLPKTQFKTILNGVIKQTKDTSNEYSKMKVVTKKNISEKQKMDLIFANKICKHSKSNAITIIKNNQLIGSGVGQPSRIDALKQAINKAKSFGFNLKGAVMSSDAFFPFSDCVKIASKHKITAIIQPGGSIRDQESIDLCNKNNISMVFTNKRHFKH